MIRLKIKEVAQEKGVSMRRLSREGNLAYKTVRAFWYNPYQEVTSTTLNKLAKYLEVRVSDLYDDISEEDANKEKSTLNKDVKSLESVPDKTDGED